MLECKLCDYYKAASHGEAAKCILTGVIFSNGLDKINMDYPCRVVPYNNHLHTWSRNKANAQKGIHEK